MCAELRHGWRAHLGTCRGLVALGLALTGACTDASHMFGGRWATTVALEQTWLDGRPELDIGHFGPELTGVAQYKDAVGVLHQDCGCGWLEGDRVDLTHQTFIATTERCAGPVLIWSLTLREEDNGDLFLDGTVGPSGVDPVPVTLELLDRFIADNLKTCEP